MIRPAASVIGAAVILTAAPMPHAAQAETTYRYWSYWIGGESWSYSPRGAGFRVPPDAGVEGYRFTVSPKDGSQASPPTPPSTYDALCPGQPAAAEGSKRVAVVLDFGTAGIAPIGETPPPTAIQCLTVPASATGLQVLQQVAELRFHSSGLICGIAGFPATECPGQTVRTASATPSPTRSRQSPQPVATAPAIPVTSPTITSDSDGSASPSVSPSASPSPTPTTASPTAPGAAPSAVALAAEITPSQGNQPQTPAWIAAIGAGMIAALLGLALLARRGRE